MLGPMIFRNNARNNARDHDSAVAVLQGRTEARAGVLACRAEAAAKALPRKGHVQNWKVRADDIHIHIYTYVCIYTHIHMCVYIYICISLSLCLS